MNASARGKRQRARYPDLVCDIVIGRKRGSCDRDALAALYDKVSPGSIMIVDDCGRIAACREAVTDFRRRRGIDEPMDRTTAAAHWQRRA